MNRLLNGCLLPAVSGASCTSRLLLQAYSWLSPIPPGARTHRRSRADKRLSILGLVVPDPAFKDIKQDVQTCMVQPGHAFRLLANMRGQTEPWPVMIMTAPDGNLPG
ncbi:hypothetical protein QBC37DRAFT_418563 [Rhypophila decipiens]|uniref:Uncharacterized protein n=1 Tax=Rhypophila decipiens TaxID=261697 RepID=A0AAN7BCD6_9PEZI|nr:hypothetical protein QBC37DRAFT_418563 [Rhypophila decipiens]